MKRLLINFDEQLLVSIREADYMARNSFEVPHSCKTLLHASKKLKGIKC